MKIVGCDLHTRYQQVAMLDRETGECVELRLEHESGEARAFYAGLSGPVRVGIEATVQPGGWRTEQTRLIPDRLNDAASPPRAIPLTTRDRTNLNRARLTSLRRFGRTLLARHPRPVRKHERTSRQLPVKHGPRVIPLQDATLPDQQVGIVLRKLFPGRHGVPLNRPGPTEARPGQSLMDQHQIGPRDGLVVEVRLPLGEREPL